MADLQRQCDADVQPLRERLEVCLRETEILREEERALTERIEQLDR